MLDARYERLVETLLPLARRLLEEQQTFLPFAGAIDLDDVVSLVDASDTVPDEGEIDVDAVLEAVRTTLDEHRDRLRAVGFCQVGDSSGPESDEAAESILLTLEAPDAAAVELGIPYRFDRKGNLVFGEIVMADGLPILFGR